MIALAFSQKSNWESGLSRTSFSIILTIKCSIFLNISMNPCVDFTPRVHFSPATSVVLRSYSRVIAPSFCLHWTSAYSISHSIEYICDWSRTSPTSQPTIDYTSTQSLELDPAHHQPPLLNDHHLSTTTIPTTDASQASECGEGIKSGGRDRSRVQTIY